MKNKLKKRVRKAAQAGVAAAPKKVVLSAKQICGTVFWSKLSRGKKIAIGKYFRQLVEQGIIRLHVGQNTSSNQRQYYRP